MWVRVENLLMALLHFPSAIHLIVFISCGCSNLHGVLHEKLLTTHMEEARKLEHLKEVTERQLLAEQQILKLEAELSEEQRKKEELVNEPNSHFRRDLELHCCL